MRKFFVLASTLAVSLPVLSHADEVVLDDVIVQGSLCAGEDCVVDADFGFDTL